MEILFLVVFLLTVAVVLAAQMISINVRLSKSNYSKGSGNTAKNLIFNKGNYGEFLTYLILEKCSEDKILYNIYLPKSNGETTEVDLISINNKGIFVYESKNYSS